MTLNDLFGRWLSVVLYHKLYCQQQLQVRREIGKMIGKFIEKKQANFLHSNSMSAAQGATLDMSVMKL